MSEPDEEHDPCPTITEKQAREKFKEYLMDRDDVEENIVLVCWKQYPETFNKEFIDFVNEHQGISFIVKDWGDDIKTSSWESAR